MALGQELKGLTVVAVEQAVAGPYCSLLLADAGARVIKVETAAGDPARNYDASANGHSRMFSWVNRGKESVVLKLSADEDVAILREMLKTADVFLHNMRPGALESKGLGRDVVRDLNPGIINLGITGYGTEGRAAELKAYDFLVQAESGLCSVTGTEENPSRVGISACDIATGLTAYSAILRALIGRGISGKGTDIDLTMFDVVADWMNMPLMAYRGNGKAPKRTGLMHALIAPYGMYECADNKQVVIGIQKNDEFIRFCNDVIEKPDLAEDPRFLENFDRASNRDAMEAEIVPAMRALTQAECIERLENANIAFSSLNTVADLSVHPFLREQMAEIDGCKFGIADLPVKGTGPRPVHVPTIGENSETLRAEFAPKTEA